MGIKNENYSSTKTLSKGLEQLITIISSSAFATLLVIVLKEITDKDFNISDVQDGIKHVSGTVIFLTPVISAIVKMIQNFYKNYFKK